MTQEEKQLLLKDLCARFPYGFKYQVQYGDTSVRDVEKFILDDEYSLFDAWMIHEIKPYLRPMSSMTKEEKSEFFEISGLTFYDDLFSCKKLTKNKLFIGKLISYLNAHHFDYNGLIEKGLALEAKKGMYE